MLSEKRKKKKTVGDLLREMKAPAKVVNIAQAKYILAFLKALPGGFKIKSVAHKQEIDIRFMSEDELIFVVNKAYQELRKCRLVD